MSGTLVVRENHAAATIISKTCRAFNDIIFVTMNTILFFFLFFLIAYNLFAIVKISFSIWHFRSIILHQ